MGLMTQGPIWTALAARRWDLWDGVQVGAGPPGPPGHGLLLALSVTESRIVGSGQPPGDQLAAEVTGGSHGAAPRVGAGSGPLPSSFPRGGSPEPPAPPAGGGGPSGSAPAAPEPCGLGVGMSAAEGGLLWGLPSFASHCTAVDLKAMWWAGPRTGACLSVPPATPGRGVWRAEGEGQRERGWHSGTFGI